jgi:hypothetical protein
MLVIIRIFIAVLLAGSMCVPGAAAPSNFGIVLAVPVIWVAGTADPTQAISAQAFAQIPANPQSKYVSVDVGHLQTPDGGTGAILDWMRALSAGKN